MFAYNIQSEPHACMMAVHYVLLLVIVKHQGARQNVVPNRAVTPKHAFKARPSRAWTAQVAPSAKGNVAHATRQDGLSILWEEQRRQT
mmetsp:Transcript_28622/g.46533  ORF Transcript_28622/g.46533 Transcript_28622/m.46533 type:complete len:88 (-) Transcript_28622:790-1053(-)